MYTSIRLTQQGEIFFGNTVIKQHKNNQKAEEMLTASEEKYRLIFYFNPLPMWIYDAETLRFLEVNEAAIRNYGYSQEEFEKMTIENIRPEEDVKLLKGRLEHVKKISSATFLNSIWRHRKKN